MELSTTGPELDSNDIIELPSEEDEYVAQFESFSSSLNEQILKVLESWDSSPEKDEESLQRGESSDPSMEGFIISMAAPAKMYQNPFQLSDNIRTELVRRSERTADRALSWSLNSFDKVGGKNTLRSVWSKLKGKNRVRGHS